MEFFVLTILVIVSIDVTLKLMELGSGKITQRTAASVALDAVFNSIFVIWAAFLLGAS